MTADIVNLRKVRKAKKRVDNATTASENRAAFGRTRGEKATQARKEAFLARKLDAHRLSDEADGDGA